MDREAKIEVSYPEKVYIKAYNRHMHVFFIDKRKPYGSATYIQEKEMKRKMLQNEQRLHDALADLVEQVVDDVPAEHRSKHMRMAIVGAKELLLEDEEDE